MIPAVPDHELLRCIGRGSYGEVWLARNVMGSFRAVKVVYRASFESERPYEREFGGLQKFEPVSRTHPGFVSLLHIGRNTHAGYFYCVMEVADDIATGQNIEPENYRPRTLASDIAARGRLPLAECVELGSALAAALSHLHARGLVHRDIKPSNIIFVQGVPKFADIGLVTDIGAKATFVGTEGYLPPEGPGTPAADLYALGKLLYEISMGKSTEQFPELPTRLRELPEASGLMRLNSIILKACEPQPAKRLCSAEELQDALGQLGQELGSGVNAASGEGRRRGSKVVILCPSSAPEDVSLALLLTEPLRAEGFVVYSDQQTSPSVEWARQVEGQILAAEVVVPILSAGTIQNEMLAYALEFARRTAHQPGGKLRVFSVSVELRGQLPRQFSLALEGSKQFFLPDAGQGENRINEFVAAVSA